MKTRHEVTIYIDETPYNIIVKDLTKKESKELNTEVDRLDKQREVFNKKRVALQRVQNQIELNEEIKHKKKVDLPFLEEQKSLYEKYYKLKDEVDKLSKSTISDEEIETQIIKQTLALRIGGKDAKAFCDTCLEYNIDISTILAEIAKVVKEAEEKK